MAKVLDLTRNLTLDEIKERDIDNLELVLKASHPVKFESKNQCIWWTGETLRKILAKLGVHLIWKPTGNPRLDKRQERLAARRVDRQMKEKGVKVESRHYGGDDFHRSGIYIYYENEIAYFISDPMYATKRSGRLILPGSDKQLFVMTNWKE